MDFWKSLLQLLDAKMQIPLPYGTFHLLCLVAVAVLSVILGRHGNKMKYETVNRIVLVTAIVTLILEVYKQVNFTFGNGSTAPSYQWYSFPWQFCSTPMYVGLLAWLCRRGRLQEALYSYLATFALFAGLAVMLYPTTVFVDTIGINIQTMVCHGGMVVIGVLLLASGQVRLEWRSLLRALPVFLFMVSTAAVMNEVAYRVGLPEGHVFNMFFISPYFEPSLPVYSLVQKALPFPWCLLVYVLGFTAAAGIVLGVPMGIRCMAKHRHHQVQNRTPAYF